MPPFQYELCMSESSLKNTERRGLMRRASTGEPFRAIPYLKVTQCHCDSRRRGMYIYTFDSASAYHPPIIW